MKTTYFYKDLNNKEHKYVGKVKLENNNIVGEIISTNETYKVSELKQVKEYVKAESMSTYLVYIDKDGYEYNVTDDDYVSHNQVIKKTEQRFDIVYHPAIEEKTEFLIKGTKKKFDGEIIEQDGKYFCKQN